jgi:hypothetical protein
MRCFQSPMAVDNKRHVNPLIYQWIPTKMLHVSHEYVIHAVEIQHSRAMWVQTSKGRSSDPSPCRPPLPTQRTTTAACSSCMHNMGSHATRRNMGVPHWRSAPLDGRALEWKLRMFGIFSSCNAAGVADTGETTHCLLTVH